MTKNIIILGAGWAGLPLAHKLLKYTLPQLDLKVTLVTPNTHFYWNVAATRGVIEGEFTDEQLFLPIEPGFSKYPSTAFQLVLGKAESIQIEKSTVTVRTNQGAEEHLVYDQLVIATGSRIATGLPFKPIGTHEETLVEWHKLQKDIKNAKSILVSGAGATGIEVAGELAAKYGPSKEVILLNRSKEILESQEGVLASVQKTINSDLSKLKVNVIHGAQVKNVGEENGRKKIELSNGNSLIVDCYLPFHGISLNTSFVPAGLLDSYGSIDQDSTMRAKGTGNVWAIGDIGNIDPKQLTITDNQIIHLATALHTVLTEKGAAPEYKPDPKAMIFVSLGKKYATGQVGNWRLWGIMVSWVKGRKLFTDSAEQYVGGKALRHSSM